MSTRSILGIVAIIVLLAILGIVYRLMLRYREKLKGAMRNTDSVTDRREFWRRDDTFAALVADLMTRTQMIVDPIRSYTLYQLGRSFNRKEGDVAEVGVYKGGTARIIAKACPDKRVYLFDTFTGMPASDPSIDFHPVGDFSDTSLERVKQLLSDCPNVEFHVGMFPDTAGPIADNRFCLVHLDVDNYGPNRDALAFFYDRMVPGGAIVFDDYQWEHTPGIKKSIDEFLADKPEKVMITAEYQCVMFKV
jgi:SAM-dependent methyltransferase